jgi:hypothetical protein
MEHTSTSTGVLLHSDTLIPGLGRLTAGEYAIGEAEGQIPIEIAERLALQGQATPLPVKEEDNAD